MSSFEFILLFLSLFVSTILLCFILIRGLESFLFPQLAKTQSLIAFNLEQIEERKLLKLRIGEMYQILAYHEVDESILDLVYQYSLGQSLRKKIDIPCTPKGNDISFIDLKKAENESAVAGMKLLYSMRNWGEEDSEMAKLIKSYEEGAKSHA